MREILDTLANTSTSVQERARFLREEISNNRVTNVRQIREALDQLNSSFDVPDMVLLNVRAVLNQYELDNNNINKVNDINDINDIRDIRTITPFNDNIINSLNNKFNKSELDIDKN